MAFIKSCYLSWIKVLDFLKHLFLLIVRIYFGWGFFNAGTNKLLHIAKTADDFKGWDIPMPEVNAYMAGTTETVCGVLLILGFATRIITIPLIVTMIVAFLTAHKETLPWKPEDFHGSFEQIVEHIANWKIAPIFTAGAFPYLFACLMVLLVGPGLISVDGVIKTALPKQAPEPGATTPAPGADKVAPPTYELSTGRRVLLRLAVATLGGLTAGAIVFKFSRNSEPGGKAEANNKSGNDKGEQATGLPLLLRDPHICRGINTCENMGKKGTTNACAGQGHCALVETHVCQGNNDCKGHGGCGNNPGENECKGQGACQVPMKADTWVKARKRFEELMTKAQIKFGDAPAA